MGEMFPKENSGLSSEELEEIAAEVIQEKLPDAEPIGEVKLDPRVERMRNIVKDIARLNQANRDRAKEVGE